MRAVVTGLRTLPGRIAETRKVTGSQIQESEQGTRAGPMLPDRAPSEGAGGPVAFYCNGSWCAVETTLTASQLSRNPFIDTPP